MPGISRRRPTMVDVAERAGVSFKTVSRVINGVSSVDKEMAERVRVAATELGYRPNQMAATLKSGAATAMIGLVIKDISNEFYAAITQGAAEIAGQRGVQLITSSTPDEEVSVRSEENTIFELCRHRVDGLLIVPRSHDQSTLGREMEMGTPMVFVDRRPVGLAADSVVIDNEAGSSMGIEHLAARGHTRIGMIFDSLDIATMRLRHDGARATMTSLGLGVDDALVITDVHGPDASAEAAARLVASDNPPTAIFCGNNRATLGVVEEVWRRGVDVAIVGFDDFVLAHLLPVPITLIAYDAMELGRAAARMLFERIDGLTGPPREIVIPVSLKESGIGILAPSRS